MSDGSERSKAGASPRDFGGTVGNTLDLVQAAIYLVAAILLVILAIVTFLIILQDMYNIVTGSMSILAIDLVLSDILVVFVITGLVQTLIVYIKSHTVDPWLVLSVGLTAIIRRVLVFGAQQSTPQATPYEDVALTAALLLVIIIGLYLIDRGRRSVVRQE
jgi:Phosphate-starvation-inducible E.